LLCFIKATFLQLKTLLIGLKVKVKEVDLYSAFIVVPHTQSAQVRITQCYLQITPEAFTRWRLPRLRLWTSNCSLLLIYLLRKDERLSRPGWLTYSGPHKWSPVSCRSSSGQAKFAGQRPTFYQCATQP